MSSGSGRPAPWARKTKGLWLPSPLPHESAHASGAASIGPASCCSNGSDAATEDDHANGGCGDAAEVDELDLLTSRYAAEAAASVRSITAHTEARTASQKGMHELRSEGLATELSAENKGYQLLRGMGWKEGQGLGATITGRAAPINVRLKAGRKGLGVEEGQQRRQAELAEQQQQRAAKRARLLQQAPASFRDATAQKLSSASAERHVVTARKTIETLDERADVAQHHMWPQPTEAEAAEGAAESGDAVEVSEPHPWELLPAPQRLADVLDYLRQRHDYCLFCGCKYDGADDLAENCPGPTEEDH